ARRQGTQALQLLHRVGRGLSLRLAGHVAGNVYDEHTEQPDNVGHRRQRYSPVFRLHNRGWSWRIRPRTAPATASLYSKVYPLGRPTSTSATGWAGLGDDETPAQSGHVRP